MRDKKEIIGDLYSALRSQDQPESLFAISKKIRYRSQDLKSLVELIEFIQDLPRIRKESRGRNTYLSLSSPPSPKITENPPPTRRIQPARNFSAIFMEYLAEWQATATKLSERRWSELVNSRDSKKIANSLFPFFEQMEDKLDILAAIEDAFLEI